MKLSVSVEQDAATAAVARTFDYAFDGTTTFEVPAFEPRPGLTLIVGPSGTGKTSILRQIGLPTLPGWREDHAIVSDFASPDDALDRLMAVGLNSVPSWLRPYRVLSNGEQMRARLARQIGPDAVIDEFTSVVDRPSAKAAARALGRLARQRAWPMTLATVHRDIIPWLNPDNLFDTRTGWEEGSWTPASVAFSVEAATVADWPLFAPHHYLSARLLPQARCFIAEWEGETVGFASAIRMPNGAVKNAWREHRTVVLPDYQGLGIGVRLSDEVARRFVADGWRYYSRTAHPRMGQYREHSSLWRPTTKNRRRRSDYTDAIQGRFNDYFVNTPSASAGPTSSLGPENDVRAVEPGAGHDRYPPCGRWRAQRLSCSRPTARALSLTRGRTRA